MTERSERIVRTERTARTVYLLCNENSDFGQDVYVGSTLLSLARRLSLHKNDSLRIGNVGSKLYTRMQQVGLENWVMRPLLTLVCSRDEIRTFEKMWWDILRADLNSYFPIRSAAERYRQNKEEICRKNAERYQQNVFLRVVWNFVSFRTRS